MNPSLLIYVFETNFLSSLFWFASGSVDAESSADGTGMLLFSDGLIISISVSFGFSANGSSIKRNANRFQPDQQTTTKQQTTPNATCIKQTIQLERIQTKQLFKY